MNENTDSNEQRKPQNKVGNALNNVQQGLNIIKSIPGLGLGGGIPGMEKGGIVKETGPVLMHKGEKVIPAEKVSPTEKNKKATASPNLMDSAPAAGRRVMGEPEATRNKMNINRDIRKGWTVLPVTEVSKVNG